MIVTEPKLAIIVPYRDREEHLARFVPHMTEFLSDKNINYKIFTIFILPPSRDELYNRLLNRDRNDEKIAKERMTQFNQDVLHWKDYDFVVINDDIGNCYKKIIEFINSADHKKDSNYQKLISKHVRSLLN